MGALVIGSKTAPVEEVVTHNKNGLLVDFHDVAELIDAVNTVLSNKNNYDKIKKNARKTIIENYDLKKICLPKQIKLIKDLIWKM